MKIELKELNIISAGAGSGKTYTVQKTLSEWLEEHPDEIRPDRILAVTFTNMAASEMQTRIRSALLSSGKMDAAMEVSSSQISTIHSFGQNILHAFSYELGMSPNVRQLSEAEEKILLQLALSSHDQIFAILKDLEVLGYKGKFNGVEFKTDLDQLQSRVLQLINTFRTIGVEKSKKDHYVSSLIKEVEMIYGDVEEAELLVQALKKSVSDLLSSYPQNMKEVYGGNNTADKEFTNDFKALQRAIQTEDLEFDWSLWKALQKLRTTKVKDEIYVDMANNVMQAAQKLAVHPGPLNDALQHIQILLEISIETLENYNDSKRQNALIDFSDMLHIANLILSTDSWLDEMVESYDCLVIDEFQDTNPIQFALLWKFRLRGLPTLVVGDLKQSIMGFQGADASLFQSLIDDKNALQHELNQNWRSTPALMDWINALGQGLYGDRYTFLEPKVTLTSTLTPLQIIDFDDEYWSAQGAKGKENYGKTQYHIVSQHIKKLIEDDAQVIDRHTKEQRSIRPSDIAILAPTHSMLGNAANSLRIHGLEAQITQDGWLSSRIIEVAFYALSLLANPMDKHAALYLLITELGELSLQDALSMYLKEKCFSHPLIEKIEEIRKNTKLLSLSKQVSALIDGLGLWDIVLEHENSTQYRANLLKLISLSTEFESLQYESLNAMGIYGRNLNSFLTWLSISENDKQPAAKSINTEAVQLLTWFASKGLEWPVVIVMGMDEDRPPKLPDMSLGYIDESRMNPLDNTYVRFFSEFASDSINEAFLNQLKDEASSTVKNLLYVAMTRAREQLTLVWPSFKEEKIKEFSFMHHLLKKCHMRIQDDTVEIDHLSRDHGFTETIIKAKYEDISIENQGTGSINYGRVAIKMMDEIELIPAQVSPSQIEASESVDFQDKLSTIEYGKGVELPVKGIEAAELGTLLHHCYHTLLVNDSFYERLNEQINGKLDESILQQIREQVSGLSLHFENSMLVECKKMEVPLLGKTEEGSVISGSVDLLLETKEGFWIIDHKSDKVENLDKQFGHHFPQLDFYKKHLKLSKPVIGVGINWIRYGKMSLLAL